MHSSYFFKKGFTIVELLIVIVVIAILATITLVTYNGINERAKSTAVVETARSYIKALALWAVDNGSYPIPTAQATCLGPASAYSGTTCPDAPAWYSPANYDAAFNQQLSTYLGNKTLPFGYWGGTPTGVFWYHSNYYGLGHAVLGYFVGPNSDCVLPNVENSDRTVTGASYTYRSSAYTTCVIQLN